MTWLVVAAIAALVLLCLSWRGKPYLNDMSDPGALAHLLRLLLSRGVHKAGIRGTLTVCDRSNPIRRLIFRKYIRGQNEMGFEATLPLEAWSEIYDLQLRAELDRRGLNYRDAVTPTGKQMEFDLGRDFGGAYMLARVLFEDVMGLRVRRDCGAYFRDVMISNTPRLTGVDDPEEGWG